MNKYIMILYFLTEIFVTLNVIYCFGKLQDKQVEVNLKNFIILLLGTTILLINNIYNKTNFMLICSFLIMVLINNFIYKEKIKDTIINTMIYVFTGMAIELILTSLFLNNLHSIEILNKNMFLVKINLNKNQHFNFNAGLYLYFLFLVFGSSYLIKYSVNPQVGCNSFTRLIASLNNVASTFCLCLGVDL